MISSARSKAAPRRSRHKHIRHRYDARMTQGRYDITFTGRVQGVGFRATAQDIAQQVGVTGWVRNEPDGSVRCVVEGSPSEADQFLDHVKAAMQRHIRDVRVEKSAATGEFKGFRVNY